MGPRENRGRSSHHEFFFGGGSAPAILAPDGGLHWDPHPSLPVVMQAAMQVIVGEILLTPTDFEDDMEMVPGDIWVHNEGK